MFCVVHFLLSLINARARATIRYCFDYESEVTDIATTDESE